jgi:bifunctional enzyme CysN/CysC
VKSALIGRLLFDFKLLFEDQLEHVNKSNPQKGLKCVNHFLFTNDLKAEREQSITIDV